MDWDRLKGQLAREAREYLADLRDIREGLRHYDGWIALALVVATIVMLAAWALASLGFSPPNEHVNRFIYKLGQRSCRPVDNFSGMVIFVDLFLLLFLALLSLGNVINMSRRARRGARREPRELIVTTSLMLLVGIGGIVFMRRIC